MGDEENPDVKKSDFDRCGRDSWGRLAWLGRELCASFKELLNPPLLFNLLNIVLSIASLVNPFMAYWPKGVESWVDLGESQTS